MKLAGLKLSWFGRVLLAATGLLLINALGGPDAVVLLVVPVALLVGVGIAARHTMPAALSPASSLQLLGGTVGILAAYGVVYLLSTGTDLNAAFVVIFALPGLLLGALIRRLWMISVPIAAATVLLAVAYLNDPTCAACGEDTWSTIIASTSLFLVAPAAFSIELGILVRNLLTRLQSSSRRQMKPADQPDVSPPE